ncbi:hypothetical protein BJV77DRAFT_991704 [Russula vinacea]|nr:hypothetical protein BJV77DRAFT_991704 [Russula vinacea]
MKRDAPSPSPSTQRRPAVTAEIPSNHRAAHSPPPPSSPALPRPEITTGIASDQRAAQSLLRSPQSIATSSLPDRATPAPNPSMKPTPTNHRHLTPLNISQERHSQVTNDTKNETLNISVMLDISCPSTPTVAVTATSGITSSYKSPGSNITVTSQAGPPGPKLEGPASKATKPDAAPPPSQPQNKKSAQRPVWKVWFQSIWNGGK